MLELMNSLLVSALSAVIGMIIESQWHVVDNFSCWVETKINK